MSNARPLASILAAVALLLMMSALGVRYWASQQASSRTGPTHIAAHHDQVVVFADKQLFVLDSHGEIVSSTGLAEAGLLDDPIDLLFRLDGMLLVAEQQPARIHLCRPQGWKCQLLPLEASQAPERQFKLLEAVGHDVDGLWISDAWGDTLLWHETGSGALETRVPAGLLAGPNSLVHVENHSLWVADTDNRRLLELLMDPPGSKAVPGREHSTINQVTIGKRHFPMLMERGPQGRLWVTLASDFSRPAADLAVYDLEKGALLRVELPNSRFATDMVLFQQGMLVTDMDAARIYRVDGLTLAASTFGSLRFNQAMESILAERSRFEFISSTALTLVIVFAVLMVLAALRATPKAKRWTPQPELFDPEQTSTETLSGKGIHWMHRRPHVDRLIRWVDVAGTAMLAVVAVSIFFTFAWLQWQSKPDSDAGIDQAATSLLVLLTVLFMVLVAMLPLLRAVKHSLQRSLGSDGKNLHIRLEDGRSLVVAPEQLLYTNRALLYRQYSVPLKDGRMQSLYEAGEIRAYLAPLLLRGTHLSPMQGLLYGWRNRDRVLIWSVISTSIVLVLVLILTLYS